MSVSSLAFKYGKAGLHTGGDSLSVPGESGLRIVTYQK